MQETDFLQDYKIEGEELPILVYPNPILTKKSRPLEQNEFNDELDQLARNMLYTMYRAPGVGLAAPQIGKNIRLFVLDVEWEKEKKVLPSGEEVTEYSHFQPQVFINPEITVLDPELSICNEGCLSVPEVYEEVARPKKIKVVYQNLKGEKQELEATDLLATCIQHEFDHLNGIIFLDRLSLIKKNLLKKKAVKRQKRTQEK